MPEAVNSWVTNKDMEKVNKIQDNILKAYEIDFLIQYKNEIIPIEVKSSENVNNKSLKCYNETYKPKTRIRFSMKNLNKDDNFINIPLFMVGYLEKFI